MVDEKRLDELCKQDLRKSVLELAVRLSVPGDSPQRTLDMAQSFYEFVMDIVE